MIPLLIVCHGAYIVVRTAYHAHIQMAAITVSCITALTVATAVTAKGAMTHTARNVMQMSTPALNVNNGME